MNSRKSLCSFAKLSSMALDEFQQQVEPLFRGQARVKTIVRLVRLFEASEYLSDALHVSNSNTA